MRAAFIAIASLWVGAQAEAGAWPREKGTTFLSFGHAASTGTTTLLTPDFQIDNYTSVFADALIEALRKILPVEADAIEAMLRYATKDTAGATAARSAGRRPFRRRRRGSRPTST